MKHILFLLLLFLSACTSDAQTSDYLFKGIPIEGTVSEFSKKLQQQGFQQMTQYQGFDLEQMGFDRITIDMLSGMFMNRSVVVAVSGDRDTHKLQAVQVEFPESGGDNALYEKIKRLLAEKYKDPEKWTVQNSDDAFNHSYKIFDAKIAHEPYIELVLNPANLVILYRNPTRFYDEGTDL